MHITKGSDKNLEPSDLLLLTNFVTNSQSMRMTESWTPVCLPAFSDKGAYVCAYAIYPCIGGWMLDVLTCVYFYVAQK